MKIRAIFLFENQGNSCCLNMFCFLFLYLAIEGISIVNLDEDNKACVKTIFTGKQLKTTAYELHDYCNGDLNCSLM